MSLDELIEKLCALRDVIGGEQPVLIETGDGDVYEPETITHEYDPADALPIVIIKTDW